VIEIVAKLGKVAGTLHNIPPDHGGELGFRVTVLASVEVQHEVDQRPFKPSALAHEDEEAGAGELCAPGQVNDAQALPQLPVGLGNKVEGGHVAQGANHDIVLFTLAVGHVRLRDVGQFEKQGAKLGLDLIVLLVEVGNLLAHLSHLGYKGRSIAGHSAYGPAGLVAMGAKPVRLGLKAPAFLVQGENVVDGRFLASPLQGGGDEFRVFADKLKGEHELVLAAHLRK
jgi:hypothetical protein